MPTWGPTAISDAGDDGFEQGGVWAANAELIGKDVTSVHIGLRWRNVTVPQGATITNALIKSTPRNLTGTITNVHGEWAGHLGDAPSFSDGVFSPTVGFSPTTARVQFDPTSWPIDSADAQVDDVTAIVQEMVNGTWASGDDMAFRPNDDGSVDGNIARMTDVTDGSGLANLTINYTVGTANVPPSQATQPAERPFNMGGAGVDTLRRANDHECVHLVQLAQDRWDPDDREALENAPSRVCFLHSQLRQSNVQNGGPEIEDHAFDFGAAHHDPYRLTRLR